MSPSDRMFELTSLTSLPSLSPLAGWILTAVLGVLLFTIWRMTGTIRRLRAELRRAESKSHGRSVKRGVLGEALAPLLREFPVDVERPGTTTLFVGQPVDYLYFDPDDGVTFIEIKSGGARLSAKQERLRDLVEAGHVRWETLHLDRLDTETDG